MTKAVFTTIIVLLAGLLSEAQSIDGYSYEKYPVKNVFKGKKAPINYNSNPTAKTYRTHIRTQYKEGKIDFAGYYITTWWGCGTGCTIGAMVDVRDGKVYDLPDCEMNSDNYCDGEDHKAGKAKSRMYVTSMCGYGENNHLKPSYTIFLWNEQKKKFIQLSTPEEKMTCDNE